MVAAPPDPIVKLLDQAGADWRRRQAERRDAAWDRAAMVALIAYAGLIAYAVVVAW